MWATSLLFASVSGYSNKPQRLGFSLLWNKDTILLSYAGNADYMLPSKTLAITKNDHNAIVNVIIRDDVLAEEYKEHYTLEFRVTVPDTGITNHPIGSKMFTIVDDEGKI